MGNKCVNKDKYFQKTIVLLTIFISIVCLLYLFMNIRKGNFEYSLSQRIPKLIAIVLTGALISFSTILFQTITNNRLLTPNVMGLDSFYVLIQTVIVYVFGSTHIFISNKKINFMICIVMMVLISTVLYSTLMKKNRTNIILIVLVGVILGTLFGSLSKFMQIMIDPNEYLTLQNKLFASFNNINENILVISVIMIVITLIFTFKDFKYLDVMSLGRDHAINLGVEYDRLTKKFFIVVSILISISTALVGPITFLGLLVVNATKQIVKSYKHSHIVAIGNLLSVFVLLFGQLLLERVLKISTPVSVIINLIGGIYFMYLLLRESKVC
nr:iron chelate uptake ABC transporter family permease subunit [Candidatus Arthromitus sp. SFB-rat-Yit]